MRGRPVLGAISGLFFGCFLAVTLQQFGIRPLDNLSFFGLPALGVVLGLAMAAWAPFGRSKLDVPVVIDGQGSTPAKTEESPDTAEVPPAND